MLTQLKDIGLSDNEARVYLAMLELGPAPVAEIAAKAGLKRPTAYVEIELLKKKGLASAKEKNGKTLFAAESPERLESLVNKARADIEARHKTLLEILPELKTAFAWTDQRPVVRYFEGKDVFVKVRREVLQCREKLIRSISNLDDVLAESPDALSRKPAERVKNKIRSKFIYTTKRGPILKKSDMENLRESKFVSPKELPVSFDFTVFDDKVVFESIRGKIGAIVIQSKNIAQSFKNLFDFIWNSIEN